MYRDTKRLVDDARPYASTVGPLEQEKGELDYC